MKCKQLDRCGGYLHGITCTFMNHDKECNIITKPKSVERISLDMAVTRFIKYGRVDCHDLKCKEKNTPSCKGNISICIKSHISYFLGIAKDKNP